MIHYELSKINVVANGEVPRISAQWENVMSMCSERGLSEIERARLAFNMVDYITSEDLPLRLLITRAPQVMAKIAEETKVHREIRKINSKNGTFYSRSKLILPNELEYRSSYSARRIINGTAKALSSRNLLNCLEKGDTVTTIDGILFLGLKRIASDIAKIKAKNSDLSIDMKRIEVFDSFNKKKYKTASYTLSR